MNRDADILNKIFANQKKKDHSSGDLHFHLSESWCEISLPKVISTAALGQFDYNDVFFVF